MQLEHKDIKKTIIRSQHCQRNWDLEQTIPDENMAIGIAAGYLNLLASMLGYGTGCCACFDDTEVSKIVKNENPIALMMGIGFKDSTKNRREHHQTGFMFPSKIKQDIEVDVIK